MYFPEIVFNSILLHHCIAWIFSSAPEAKKPEPETNGESKEAGDKTKQPGDEEEETRSAACALYIGAGSFDEPEDVGGLAHFLEHMLFMGSEKFPDENG